MQKKIQTVESWLAAPDSSVNFRAALQKRHAGTGLWFTQHRKYTEWKQNPGTILWAHGIGKPIFTLGPKFTYSCL
jgi:hypothetical protein